MGRFWRICRLWSKHPIPMSLSVRLPPSSVCRSEGTYKDRPIPGSAARRGSSSDIRYPRGPRRLRFDIASSPSTIQCIDHHYSSSRNASSHVLERPQRAREIGIAVKLVAQALGMDWPERGGADLSLSVELQDQRLHALTRTDDELLWTWAT